MKILEAQNALLSNYEVYQHLVDQQVKNKAHNRRVPAQLSTLTTEVITYLRTKPGPLAHQEEKHAYSAASIPLLMEKLREANLRNSLEKGEVLSILNLRPAGVAQLSTAIEDMEERFTEEEQQKIVDITAEVLGRDEPEVVDEENGEEGGDGENTAVPSIENGY
ncbi:RNA polymerase Rpb4-domain-containing protein [Bombardia bombarda]|uniref:DNA-directed RNA polymerase III subunit RPC9 n=1 Tax=Bombardia bombarda TaxID=252184 RepID=A0AA40BW35_9PEZI|nr:RNA polymerase Rpb4-domain-containing protein [Bombardia bombarda]